MPVEGFKSLTVNDKTHELLQAAARSRNLSVSSVVEVLAENSSLVDLHEAFSSEDTKVKLARLVFDLDCMAKVLQSLIFPHDLFIDLKLMKLPRHMIKEPETMGVETTLSLAGMLKERRSPSQSEQIIHDLKERKEMMERILAGRFPKWTSEIERSPQTRLDRLWLPDSIQSFSIDLSKKEVKKQFVENVTLYMTPQLDDLYETYSEANRIVEALGSSFPELNDLRAPLQKYYRIFEPGFIPIATRKLVEHMEPSQHPKGQSGAPIGGGGGGD